MKSCPTCHRTYPDDTLAFCLMDGSVLSAPYDPDETPIRRERRGSSAPRTEVLNSPVLPPDTSPTRKPVDTNSPLPSTVRAVVPPLTDLPANEYQTHSADRAVPALTQWAFLIRGVIGVLLFVNAFARSEPDSRHLLSLFGLYALSGGVCMLVAGGKTLFGSRREWLITIDGLCGIIFGGFVVSVVRAPSDLTSLWMLATGIFQLVTTLRFQKRTRAWWLLGLASVVSIVSALILLLATTSPSARFIPYLMLIEGYMLGSGVLLLTFGVMARTQR